MNIRKAGISDIPMIQKMAYEIWPVTYGTIISEAQLDYMLNLIYSERALQNQFQNGQDFYLISEAKKHLGFMALEHFYKGEPITRIHKLYVIPFFQGKGIGKKLIEKAIELGLKYKIKRFSLNVNRFNQAFHFYQKLGFQMIKEENIDIGNGYLMEDYIMEKQL